MVDFNRLSIISALKKGSLVVYPTDTLYGIGADIFNEAAVKKVFSVKNRPFSLPISIAVAGIAQLSDVAFVDDSVMEVVDFFLPGRLTLVLKKKKIVSDIITASGDKVAVRIPDNLFALDILSNFGPLTCTSANLHGRDTPFFIKDISMHFKEGVIAEFIDDGCLDGKASTIVDLSGEEPLLLRKGDISLKQILDVI